MAEVPQTQPSRACKCLNVRIRPQLHLEKLPDFLIAAAADSGYAPTYVGDKGISIAHPQVTMRTRKIGPPIEDSSRCIRFTTLTCLLCQTVAYRVQQLVASDVDIQEGPLLPSPDWVEQETLLSSCGWIEVHKDCLLAEDVTRLLSSSVYSSTFGIALPQNMVPSATPTQPTHESNQQSPAQDTSPVGPFLYNLKPLFLPAPFVPSHPVFAHLSSIAVKASEHLRSLAEEQIAAIVRDKCAELEQADDRLRHDVEALWRKFVETMGEVEKQLGPRADETRRRDSSRGVSLSTFGVSGTPLISIRNFVPTPSRTPRMMSASSSRSRISSLSASLATSAFYHDRMAQGPTEPRDRSPSGSPRSPPPYSSHPSSLGSESPISSSLEISPGLSLRKSSDSVVQPFKRSMDEARDTAVSFRYFTILEADVTRARQLQGASQPDARSEGAPKAGESARETGSSNTAKVTTPDRVAEEAHPPESSDRNTIPPADETPRRRKVKFDIKAEVVTGDGVSPRVNAESRENEELIFDLEDSSSGLEASDAAPTLPFAENAQARCRGRSRIASLGALPASLSSLRPKSLPPYSILHSKATEEPTTSASNNGALPTIQPALLLQEARSEYPEQPDPQEEEILKLVAANTPSHRSAWKRNSKAWKLFVSRRRNGVPGALIPEETEDGSGQVADTADGSDWGSSRDIRWSLGDAGFPASLPIDIGPLSRQREPLSLASYQPQTSLSDRAGSRRHTSSATLRRASYAERDRSRAIDPGALDFIVGDGEEAEDDESDEEPSKANVANEGRGRQRAFKILQARSKIPEEGMWMSLA
ncbi:hypothetical protein HD554DRAFT_2046213 [Boletus coccyginus]|nr:hypothetical protein HD554DRAFT_2046213 [Boletus coccyginus]